MMLIIREKPDYYDSAIGFGVDKSIVYPRKTRPCDEPALKSRFEDLTAKIRDSQPFVGRTVLEPFYVGFCGRIYTGTYAFQHKKTGEYVSSLYRKNPEDFELKTFWSEKDYPKALLDEKGPRRSYLWTDLRGGPKTVREWLNTLKQGIEAPEVFQDYRLVSFVRIDRQIELEPCLKDLGFQRVIGGVEAFQEIMMFISGVLGMLDKETIVTEDKYIAMSKGFDERSFRKDPTKKI